MTSTLRLVFWETTKACNLSCRHCRAVPQKTLGPTELTTRRAMDLIDDIARVARPVMVLSGGEPLFRPDLFDIGAYGVESGFRMALATNGTLVTDRVAAKIADAGFARVAISLDGARADTHDRFRGVSGSHARALGGLRYLREEGVSVQINSTIARHNAAELPDLLDLALDIGADALHLFMLVPVGCGLEIAPAEMLAADEYERVLHWFDDQSKTCPIDLKATCAPHYRIRAQRLAEERSRGDRALVHPPGTKARPLRLTTHPPGRPRPAIVGDDPRLPRRHERLFHLERGPRLPVRLPARQRWRHPRSDLRGHLEQLAGLSRPARPEGARRKCRLPLPGICGGCRARAYAATGSYLAEEPFCSYQPDGTGSDRSPEVRNCPEQLTRTTNVVRRHRLRRRPRRRDILISRAHPIRRLVTNWPVHPFTHYAVPRLGHLMREEDDMRHLQSGFTRADRCITTWVANHGVAVLRVSVGIVFFWFGVLKFFPTLSPAEDLAARTISALTFGIVTPAISLPVLAAWECLIGLALITGQFLRGALVVMFVHMSGTITPLFLFPHETWTQIPYAATLEGQYIIKNLVLVSAGLVIYATVREGAAVDDAAIAGHRPPIPITGMALGGLAQAGR